MKDSFKNNFPRFFLSEILLSDQTFGFFLALSFIPCFFAGVSSRSSLQGSSRFPILRLRKIIVSPSYFWAKIRNKLQQFRNKNFLCLLLYIANKLTISWHFCLNTFEIFDYYFIFSPCNALYCLIMHRICNSNTYFYCFTFEQVKNY